MVQQEMLSMKKINEVLRVFILKEMYFFNFFSTCTLLFQV